MIGLEDVIRTRSDMLYIVLELAEVIGQTFLVSVC